MEISPDPFYHPVGNTQGIERLDVYNVTADPLAANSVTSRQAVCDAIQTALDPLISAVRLRMPSVVPRFDRASGTDWWLCGYSFPCLERSEPGVEEILVLVTFDVTPAGCRVSGDISADPRGWIFQNAGPIQSSLEHDQYLAAGITVAEFLAARIEVVLNALGHPPLGE